MALYTSHASAMLKPLTIFAQAHHWRIFFLTTAACGAIALAIARVPLPQVGLGLGDITRAVGFFLTPLLPMPALSFVLGGLRPYERHAARSLAGPRLLLAVFASAWVFAALLPAALTGPTPNAVEVLTENCSAVLGLTLLLGCWLDPRWSWIPVFALTLIGVSGPDYGWMSKIAFVDRTASPADLAGGCGLLAISIGLYAFHGPPRR